MRKHPDEKPGKTRTSRRRSVSAHPASDDAKRRSRSAIKPLDRRVKLPAGRVDRKTKAKDRRTTVWTVGHSTRPVSDLIALLQGHRIRRLVDVRSIPRSRHNPQFNQDQIEKSLTDAGIQYIHIPALGGLRHARRDSTNMAWQNAGFRGFADYMQTPEFDAGLKELIHLARNRRTAIMCAEAVPWRCHRSLIGDALLAHGIHVEEITSKSSTRPHLLTPWASVDGKRVTYPSPS